MSQGSPHSLSSLPAQPATRAPLGLTPNHTFNSLLEVLLVDGVREVPRCNQGSFVTHVGHISSYKKNTDTGSPHPEHAQPSSAPHRRSHPAPGSEGAMETPLRAIYNDQAALVVSTSLLTLPSDRDEQGTVSRSSPQQTTWLGSCDSKGSARKHLLINLIPPSPLAQ